MAVKMMDGGGGMREGPRRRVSRICLIMCVMGAFISLRMGRARIRCKWNG